MDKITVEFSANRVGVEARTVSTHNLTDRGAANALRRARAALDDGILAYGNRSGAVVTISANGTTYSLGQNGMRDDRGDLWPIELSARDF
ncbi:hypothetical protein [Pseudogemmobacter sonorensis]|uniref:hypothetical protein n=1 Tax=Pseudogemmobacter sonorensis TaxID=2989681 RepID=UPI00368ABD44